jgi:hypothetical protein
VNVFRPERFVDQNLAVVDCVRDFGSDSFEHIQLLRCLDQRQTYRGFGAGIKMADSDDSPAKALRRKVFKKKILSELGVLSAFAGDTPKFGCAIAALGPS